MTDFRLPWNPAVGQQKDRYGATEYRDNFDFTATLTLEFMSWSYGSTVKLRDDETGLSYYMFITDFEKMILHGISIIDKKVTAHWTFIKRGTKYGLRAVEAPK